jgi:hypothetical protein
MRKTVLVLASVALALLLVSGVAWAAKIRCERGSTVNHPCHGTKSPDIVRGTSGRDSIIGYPNSRWQLRLPRDHDTIYGYGSYDRLFGGGEGTSSTQGGPTTCSMAAANPTT